MQVTTKYDINNDVWAIHPQLKKAYPAKIAGINTLQSSTREVEKGGEKEIDTVTYTPVAELAIHYQLDFGPTMQAAMMVEKEVYPSKEELIKGITG